jgi:Uncharacterized conserved protein
MGIAITMEEFLAEQHVRYDLLRHAPTATSMRTAEAGHIPGDALAKGVVLKDEIGYLLAILPATHHVRLDALEAQTHRHLQIAAEQDMARLFPDCARGAVPVFGSAYGLDTIVDDSIAGRPDVYFEGGDHETLVHMDGNDFQRLTAQAAHGRFSEHD